MGDHWTKGMQANSHWEGAMLAMPRVQQTC